MLRAQAWTLWVKREGTDGAQYLGVGGMSPDATVDELKARWVTSAQLRVSRDLVVLALVAGATPRQLPSDAEVEQALRLEDAALTLRQAGLGNGSRLLACVVGGGPGVAPRSLEIGARSAAPPKASRRRC